MDIAITSDIICGGCVATKCFFLFLEYLQQVLILSELIEYHMNNEQIRLKMLLIMDMVMHLI